MHLSNYQKEKENKRKEIEPIFKTFEPVFTLNTNSNSILHEMIKNYHTMLHNDNGVFIITAVISQILI